MSRAFSITELVIVIAILGIMAAIVVPQFRGEVTQAKEATAKDHLRSLRGAIELYASRHSGIGPGYTGGVPSGELDAACFAEQTVAGGECLRRIPRNPFNDLDTVFMIGNSESFPESATGQYGWIYQPALRLIHMDWPGTDADGVRYIDY